MITTLQELRKPLTELQFKTLVDAQLRYNQLTAETKVAYQRLEEVRSLVLDAVGLSLTGAFAIDANKREIVVSLEVEDEHV